MKKVYHISYYMSANPFVFFYRDSKESGIEHRVYDKLSPSGFRRLHSVLSTKYVQVFWCNPGNYLALSWRE